MTTLTETAYQTRQIIKYGSIFLVIFLIVRGLWIAGFSYYEKLNPPPPPPPTVGFGKLPAINFPKKEGLPPITYKLETINGTLPKLDTVGKVYVVPKQVANLLALDRAKDIARRLGYASEPIQASDRLFRFMGKNNTSVLEYDVVARKIWMQYNYLGDPTILQDKKLPIDEQAVTEARAFLRSAGLSTPDLEKGRTKITYWHLDSGKLNPAISLSEADFVRVDLFRSDLDDWKVMTPSPNDAQVYLIFSGVRNLEKRVVELSYSHSPVSAENFATYPLKTTETAWQDLLNNAGYLAQLGENGDGKVTVRKVTLAYFETNGSGDFLQPIYVFEGDRNFIAYVPAIDSKWLE